MRIKHYGLRQQTMIQKYLYNFLILILCNLIILKMVCKKASSYWAYYQKVGVCTFCSVIKDPPFSKKCYKEKARCNKSLNSHTYLNRTAKLRLKAHQLIYCCHSNQVPAETHCCLPIASHSTKPQTHNVLSRWVE